MLIQTYMRHTHSHRNNDLVTGFEYFTISSNVTFMQLISLESKNMLDNLNILCSITVGRKMYHKQLQRGLRKE